MGETTSCAKAKKRQSLSTEVHYKSLKQEILHLQRQLEDQFLVRSALEKALASRPLSRCPTNESPTTKPAKDLIKEIAVLEMEVVFLEKYLLSLYRKTFDERVPFISVLDETSKSTAETQKWMFSEVPRHDVTAQNENSVITSKESSRISGAKTLVDSSIRSSQSSLSQRLACSFKTSSVGSLAEAVHSFHSLPLSMLERNQCATSNVTSLAEHLRTSTPDPILEKPNWLSEEMIKCIAAIYIELAEPPLFNHGFRSSPISFFSSSETETYPQCQYDMHSPKCRDSSYFRFQIDNPFNIEGSEDFSASYRAMVEVRWICRDSQRLKLVKDMLQNFRSLVSWLKEVDPKRMKHEEKLAFWINVHNALVMHAFLVYGIPRDNQKRVSQLLKAAYNVGGHTISVDMIQSSVLGCRLPRPGQWLRQSLFLPKTNFKVGDARKAYAVDHPDPRLCFALCSGSHSDPAVRMYTAKSVFQELEAAKEDYIHTTFRITKKEQKIFLPKIVGSFAKKAGLCPAGYMEMIEHFMPETLRKSFQHQHQLGKFLKRIEWIPHNFIFRYLLSNDLIGELTLPYKWNDYW